VFLLGPSHHVYTRKCVLSSAQEYSTPLGTWHKSQQSEEHVSNADVISCYECCFHQVLLVPRTLDLCIDLILPCAM